MILPFLMKPVLRLIKISTNNRMIIIGRTTFLSPNETLSFLKHITRIVIVKSTPNIRRTKKYQKIKKVDMGRKIPIPNFSFTREVIITNVLLLYINIIVFFKLNPNLILFISFLFISFKKNLIYWFKSIDLYFFPFPCDSFFYVTFHFEPSWLYFLVKMWIQSWFKHCVCIFKQNRGSTKL